MKKSLIILFTTLALCLSFELKALNPSRTYKQYPDTYNMIYDEHQVTTADGATLNAWYFPCSQVKTTALVLISHNGEGNMADYLRKVVQFRMSYNVMAFDYRGFGASNEFKIGNNLYI